MSSILTVPEDEDGLCQHNLSAGETVRLGQDAMARQRRGWQDWMAIAAALDVGRIEVMRALHTNQPMGQRYEKAMAEWLTANGFAEIDKGARCRLLQCLQHREDIERWRSRLAASERFRFNHPQSVLRWWQKSITGSDPKPQSKPSPVAKLKKTIATLEENNHRMRREIERGGGDLWSTDDHNRDIAQVMLTKLGISRAKSVVRELSKLIKEAERK